MYVDPTGMAMDPSVPFVYEIFGVVAGAYTVLRELEHMQSMFPTVWVGMLFTALVFSVYSSMSICTAGGTAQLGSPIKDRRTSYQLASGEYCDPRRVRYVVAPGDIKGKTMFLGDATLVIDVTTGKYVWAIVGDSGPDEGYQECSISVAWDLGYTDAWGNRATEGGPFAVLYFPGTKFFIGATSIADLEKFFGWVSWYGRKPRSS